MQSRKYDADIYEQDSMDDPDESERKAADFDDVGSVLSKYKGMFLVLGGIVSVYVGAFIASATGLISKAVCNWIIIPFTILIFIVYMLRRNGR